MHSINMICTPEAQAPPGLGLVWYWSRLKFRDRSQSCASRNPVKEALTLDSSFRWNDKAFKRYQYRLVSSRDALRYVPHGH